MKDEREIAKFFEARRGDASQWEETASEAIVRRDGKDIFSVRFAAHEVIALSAAATAEGIDVIEFIRRTALEAATSKREQ